MKKDVKLNSNYNLETISDYTLEIENKYKEVEDYYYEEIVKLILFIKNNINLKIFYKLIRLILNH